MNIYLYNRVSHAAIFHILPSLAKRIHDAGGHVIVFTSVSPNPRQLEEHTRTYKNCSVGYFFRPE